MVTTFQAAIEEIPETPALVIDLPTADRNIQRLADYAASHQIRIRPHTKTHKSLFLAQRQMQAGANGLTAAKVGEAETMSGAADDLLVAYPAIDPARTRRLAELARHRTVRVAVDSLFGIDAVAAAARAAGSTIGILVDLDIGFHRTGVSGPEEALKLAEEVARLAPALRLDGLFFYPGHVWSSGAQQAGELELIDTQLKAVLDLWKRHGFEAGIVSGGSTPTAFQSHLVTSQTEIRPGTYIFNDMNTARAGFVPLEDCAAALICTVVSTTVAGKAVVDAGTKTLTSDRNATQPDSGHGLVLEYPSARIVRLSEEHGEIDFSQSPEIPRVGERVSILPNHICPCINLQNQVWLQQPGERLRQITIDARGLLT